MEAARKAIQNLRYRVPEAFTAAYRDYVHALYASRLVVLYLFSIILIPGAVVFDYLIFKAIWQQLFLVRMLSMASISKTPGCSMFATLNWIGPRPASCSCRWKKFMSPKRRSHASRICRMSSPRPGR